MRMNRLAAKTQQEKDRENYIKHGDKIRKRSREYEKRTGYIAKYWASNDERNAYCRAMYAIRKQKDISA
jgi:hypothetical protein